MNRMVRMLGTLVALVASIGSLSGCGRLFYFPDQDEHSLPQEEGFKVQEYYFKAGDGTKLHGWFFPSLTQKAKGTVVQFHGNAENMSSHYDSLVWLTVYGYNLFSFDYRGYGKSEGTPNQLGTYKDGMAALDEAWKLHETTGTRKAGGKFVVFGQSLGGVISMRSFSDFRHQDETALIVMDSTFASYKDMVRQKLAGFWLTRPISSAGRILVSDKFGTEEVLPRLRTPLLVIHDHRDSVVSFENGKKIYQLAALLPPEKKYLWELNEGRHIAVFADDSSGNRKRFLAFLDDLFSGSSNNQNYRNNNDR